jgi:hypothetical protein
MSSCDAELPQIAAHKERYPPINVNSTLRTRIRMQDERCALEDDITTNIVMESRRVSRSLDNPAKLRPSNACTCELEQQSASLGILSYPPLTLWLHCEERRS